jgi:transcription antitermination factor NusG
VLEIKKAGRKNMTTEAVELWYALQVRVRYEKRTAMLLREKGFDPFLPLRKCRRRWSDRHKDIEEALFPGYLFCRFALARRISIFSTCGVRGIVGNGRYPVAVDEAEIEAIQAIVASGIAAERWPYLRPRQPVCIEAGPLAGLRGEVIEFNNRRRLVVSVTLLQRAVSVEIDPDWVIPASPTGVPHPGPGRAIAANAVSGGNGNGLYRAEAGR